MKIKDYSDIEVLEAYLLGQLNAKDSYEVEKLCLEDPFVAEALDGLKHSHHLRYNLSILQKQLHQKVAQKSVEKKKWQITSQRLSIASTAAVLFIIVSLLFWFKINNAKSALVFEGSVQDLNTKQAIENVQVELPNYRISTFTMSNGKFQLQMEKDFKYPLRVIFSAPGYDKLDVKVEKTNANINTFQLKPIIKKED